ALRAETKALEFQFSSRYDYEWLLLALIHLARGDREQARHWALGVFQGFGVVSNTPGYDRLLQENKARLQELLPTDAEGVREALEHALEVQRRAEGPVDFYASRLRNWLADQLAELGRYGEATALFEESMRLDPDHKRGIAPMFSLGVLALRKGDRDGHRALCD